MGQIHLGRRRCETERRLQRRMKSVSARLAGELDPFGGTDLVVWLIAKVGAGV